MKRFLEFISEARSSQAAKQAHKLGFVGDGHGFWVDRDGTKQAQTVKGKLEFLKSKKKESGSGGGSVGPRTIGTPPGFA
jgi:UDP-2,3-diacylglucosamine pyrophosphatase LpxH